MNLRRWFIEWVDGELAKDFQHELKMIESKYAFEDAKTKELIDGYKEQFEAAEKYAEALFEEKRRLEAEVERLHQVVMNLKGLGDDFGAKTEGKRLKI